MSTRPTGRLRDLDGTPYLVFERTFQAPIADVWAAVTEPERLERWIGTWTGDPAEGSVAFRMTAESPDAAAQDVLIEECLEPRRLVMRSPRYGEESLLWTWRLDLAEAPGEAGSETGSKTGTVTTLTFSQEVTDRAVAESLGPGWDYYLDRLVAAETGADVATVDFADYEPAFLEHYRTELA